jgi:hypothetical protein
MSNHSFFADTKKLREAFFKEYHISILVNAFFGSGKSPLSPSNRLAAF